MIDFQNETSFEVDLKELENILSSLTSKNIELILTTNQNIKIINRDYRNIDKETDVLSFPYKDNFLLGTIIIPIDKVKEKAEELKHSELDELKLLFIHGLLHILGYDHEVDNGEMREEEKRLIKKFNLPDSLIIRNEDI